MILVLQAVTRLVTLVLLVLLALVGIAVAVFSIPGGDEGLSRLAELARLPAVRDEVGAFLETLEAGEATDAAWIAGFGAALVALLLLAGVLWRRRERLVPLAGAPPAESSPDDGRTGGDNGDGSSSDAVQASDDDGQAAPAGRLAARRRPLAQMAAALAGRVRETETLSLKVRPRRRKPGGRMRITATFDRNADPEAGTERIREEVRPVAEPFALRPRVRVRPVREDSR